jgi:MFS family permease
LNLPSWRKWAILILVAAYGCSAVVLASGLGPIFTSILASYPGEELKANDLLTYPTLFMGVGNVIAMPLAMAIGRRPIFLASIFIMVVGGIWCAFAPNLDMHIAGRNIMSLAAGQSEALAPLIVQEIHFLHERGRKLAWFIFIQNVSNCVFFITSTYMTSAWGWRWWYGFFTIFSGVILAFSYVFVSETEFDRPSDASTGQVHLDFNDKGELEDGGNVHKLVQVTTRHGTVLEPERYGARTWKRDLRLINIKPRWHLVLPHYKHIAQGLCIPTIFWLLIVNGAWLGMYVFTAGTFATILVPPPYGFAFNSLGYVQAGQIVCFMIFLPLAGYGSDWLIKRLSMRNDGVFKPEYRLIGLALPAVVGVISAVVYGQAAQRPAEWHWSAIVVPYNAVNFAFNCVNLVGITYAVESFPQRAASLLVVICAGRGIISFGLSYSTLPAIKAIGYDGALNIQAGIGGGLTAMAIGVWFVGPRIRAMAAKWFNMEEAD